MMHFLHTHKTQSWTQEIPETFLEMAPAVFETLRTYDGKIFWLDQHIARLTNSAKVLGIKTPFLDLEKLEQEILQARDENFVDQDLRIRIQLNTNGYCVMVFVLEDWPEKYYQDGIEITDVVFERPTPEAKYTTWVYQQFVDRANELGVQEIIFFDEEGNLREGNRTNVFAVLENQIITPKDNILKGVMRTQVIEIANSPLETEGLGGILTEQNISYEELAKADEILLTNALKGIIPVSKWDKWERSSDHMYTKIKKIFDNIIK